MLVLCALVASGCFNHRRTGNLSTSTTSALSSTVLPGDGSNALYLCPSSPNVVPSYDRYLDGRGFFRVCKHRTSAADIKIHGRAYSPSGICVFPVQYVDSRNIFAKPDVATGAPWSQCYPLPVVDPNHIEDSGIYANFPGINWNAVVIVDTFDNVAMRTCLYSGQLNTCPDYSLGKFRE